MVLSHSVALGKYGSEEFGGWSTGGTLAVYGFFGISGFLIAASAERYGIGRYLWHRFLRIFPAFWLCLVATAFAFGWLAWLHSRHACGYGCYLSQSGGPIGYIVHNAWLRMDQSGISGTLAGQGPYATIWNGSLWTLFYEFTCYLLLGILTVAGLLRHRLLIASLAGLLWVLEIVATIVPNLNAHVTDFNQADGFSFVRLLPIFLVGSVIYLYRELVPDSGWWALLCSLIAVASFPLPLGNGAPGYTLTRADMVAPLLVYPTLWVGAHLPWPEIAARNDYSYGTYLYAFPVAQVLALYGVTRWGYVAFTGLTLLCLAPFAVTSWWLVEKNALRLRNLELGGVVVKRRRRRRAASRAET